jgi:hypothetical protein
MSFQGERRGFVLRPQPASLSTTHGGVIGPAAFSLRFPVAVVSRVTEQSPVASYLHRVELARAPVRTVAFLSRRVPRSSVASALQSSPKVVLAPVVQVWRRAAAASKFQRIALRLVGLAAGRPRQ